MGNLHEKVPGYAEDMSPKKNSLRAVKFNFFRHGP